MHNHIATSLKLKSHINFQVQIIYRFLLYLGMMVTLVMILPTEIKTVHLTCTTKPVIGTRLHLKILTDSNTLQRRSSVISGYHLRLYRVLIAGVNPFNTEATSTICMLRSVMHYTGPVLSPYRQTSVIEQVSTLYLVGMNMYGKPILKPDTPMLLGETLGSPDMDQCVI